LKHFRSAGYLAMLLPVALLFFGHAIGFDWLLPLCYFVAFPLLRTVFGSSPEGNVTDWASWERSILDWLPRFYLVTFLASMLWALQQAASNSDALSSNSVGFMVSVLVMCGLGACVAHDLLHRVSRWDRRAANLISAVAGYPFFAFEHLAHHLHSRHTESAHCARTSENVWEFTARRFLKAPGQALAMSREVWNQARRPSALDSVWLYIAITCATWIAFAAVAGWYGFALFALLVVGVPFLLNTITFIQHWGLGDDSPVVAQSVAQVAWDDDCRLESWMILGISFHEQHHLSPRLPYYHYAPTVGAPKLPAEYAIMVLISFIPSLWRHVMHPVLAAWKVNPTSLRSAGRGLYAPTPIMRESREGRSL
jgi:alkane 1-monooxygenase